MHGLKMIVAAVLTLLVLIVLLQNLESTETDILFWTFTMPRAALIFLATVVGFTLGVLAAMILRRRPVL